MEFEKNKTGACPFLPMDELDWNQHQVLFTWLQCKAQPWIGPWNAVEVTSMVMQTLSAVQPDSEMIYYRTSLFMQLVCL